ncbi:ArsR/SmtB family transcription factor [Actinokineospora bangkokensis]|uniref:HTH arsR-type domain-containing protein n=1 Tax=Actinokineospora bangkokensis TaxID=1193682 RepID=A0A1Q9LCT0_9PSEU|nr:metalloregulator ArsR/SmtB family transcription factor [Actinokineospora bangkokensis]OLR89840.1 hypothetical protein BJP25_02120 [Actinokineospora bangkokensis]
MARAPAAADAFTAVAEPRRRQIVDLLAAGERSVSDLVEAMGVVQPLVSKHLRVLREVGLVEVREVGRQRLYRLNGAPLREVHDWVKQYARTWERRFSALDDVLRDLTLEQGAAQADGEQDRPEQDRPEQDRPEQYRHEQDENEQEEHGDGDGDQGHGRGDDPR